MLTDIKKALIAPKQKGKAAGQDRRRSIPSNSGAITIRFLSNAEQV
jgi:hypothetical protein